MASQKLEASSWYAKGCVAAAFLLAFAPLGDAQPREPAITRLPLLTTAREAHSLTQEHGARGYPVRLRAVVTYYDADIDNRHGALFVQDATAGIFVWVPSRPVLAVHAGSVVVVSGLTSAANYAPMRASGERTDSEPDQAFGEAASRESALSGHRRGRRAVG